MFSVKQCHKSAISYSISYSVYVFLSSGVPNLSNIKLRNTQNPLKVAYLNTTAILDIHWNMHSREEWGKWSQVSWGRKQLGIFHIIVDICFTSDWTGSHHTGAHKQFDKFPFTNTSNLHAIIINEAVWLEVVRFWLLYNSWRLTVHFQILLCKSLCKQWTFHHIRLWNAQQKIYGN